MDRRWMRFFIALGASVGTLALPAQGFPAETADPVAMSKTRIILKLDAKEPLSVRTSFQDRPPTITIEFPSQQVTSSLPERSVVMKGVVQAIAASYRRGSGAASAPFIQSLHIELSAPYAYRVQSEADRIVVDIEHPASVGSAAVEVGLTGGTIIGQLGEGTVSERFRAMQAALASATPTPWTLQIGPRLDHAGDTGFQSPAGRSSERAVASGSSAAAAGQSARPQGAGGSAASPHHGRSSSPHSGGTRSSMIWFGLAVSAALILAAGLRFLWLSRGEAFRLSTRGSASRGVRAQPPAGIVLIDQLMWRAFERQGYQLVIERALTSPPGGTLRVMAKDGSKEALLFVGNGPFFEKQTVERFVRAMREVSVERGILVAAGSFTVPAQRIAKEHAVTLIGRDQLVELLSAGATSEYLTKQFEQQQARLDEAKETLQQYAAELDTLRRQRNEASWFLGEEREKTAALEAQFADVSQQIRRHEAELARWEQEASTLRKHWEENQWYLGESQVRVRYLEAQLAALQDVVKRVERAEQERDEANWYLGEERNKRVALETHVAELQERVDESAGREQALQDALDQLKREFSALRVYWGERRSGIRVRMPDAFVELRNGGDGPLYAGAPRDLSSTGVGLETDQELPALAELRVRLNIPGCTDPIDSKAQLIWQQAEGKRTTRYYSGCQLVDVPEATRTRMQQLIEQFQLSRG